jgi:hypothetical protein
VAFDWEDPRGIGESEELRVRSEEWRKKKK